jgi:demethylmenaquinone methyltransferase / 2-methoxy-6-polyprenyl-1,4-benzoquinol methylase
LENAERIMEGNHQKVRQVQAMFARISSNYDSMNRLMTFWMDMSWRRILISKAKVSSGGRMLDVGTGTGDIALETVRLDNTLRVTGLDFTPEMLHIGAKREGAGKINWCRGDALNLPFPDSTFDAVVSGFLIRNVADVYKAFHEQVRVVKPGGQVVCLDTSPVSYGVFRPLIMFYLNLMIPMIGKIFTGEGDAYRYLTTSTLNFIKPHDLVQIMRNAGLDDVRFKRLLFGTIAVHWGMRPKTNQQPPS